MSYLVLECQVGHRHVPTNFDCVHVTQSKRSSKTLWYWVFCEDISHHPISLLFVNLVLCSLLEVTLCSPGPGIKPQRYWILSDNDSIQHMVIEISLALLAA